MLFLKDLDSVLAVNPDMFSLLCFFFLVCVCLFAYGDFAAVRVRTVFSVGYRNIEPQNGLC